MANSVHLDRFGGDWPLGYINVAASGTPARLMANVDAAGVNDPSTPTPGTSGADEYTVNAQQIIFQGFHPSAGKMVANTGNVYLIRKPVGAGTGNLTDTGVIVAVIAPGATFVLGSSAMVKNVFNPYRYLVDVDISGEGVQATLIIQ